MIPRRARETIGLVGFLSLFAPITISAPHTFPQGAGTVVAQAEAAPEVGTLPDSWITGGPNCAEVPDWQVHAYNESFFILRESGCTNYEKPFLYLIFGNDAALLEDTGAGQADTAGAVMRIVRAWLDAHHLTSLPLLVCHSHAHGDHIAGDKALAGLRGVKVAGLTEDDVRRFFGLTGWPDATATLDLGGRVLDVIPIPGHEPSSIALYDRRTAILLTGDTVYPGRLYVTDIGAYQQSIDRLIAFTATRRVVHILGTHIEQSATPFVDYPRGTRYQPNEHALALGRGALLELREALALMKDRPMDPSRRVDLRDFSIVPRPGNGAP